MDTMSAPVLKVMDRIEKQKGVLGLLVVDANGETIKSSFKDDALGKRYASSVPGLARLARSMVRDLDPQDDLEFLRVRSEQHEIMVAIKEDFVLVGVQAYQTQLFPSKEENQRLPKQPY